MNKNLVPTSIVDKNGKVTTVHRKPQDALLEAGKSIPSPVFKRRAEVDRNLIAAALKAIYDITDEDAMTTVCNGQTRLHPFTEDHLRTITEKVGEGKQFPCGDIMELCEDFSPELEKRVMDYITFEPYVEGADNFDATTLSAYIGALHEYPQFKETDFDNPDEDSKRAMGTLISVAIIGQEDEFNGVAGTNYAHRASPFVGPKKLVSLIMDRPDQGDQIIELLRHNGWNDSLEEYLDNPSHIRLSDGLL